MLRTLLLQCLFLLAFASLSSQVTDNFLDGDFTNNPTWVGDVGEWEVVGGELHLNRMPNMADTSYLSTPSTVLDNGTWEFNVRVNNRPSTTNYVEFFLASDNSDLESSLNGYSVRVGYTTREISLYRVTGTSKVEIIDGLDSTMYFPPYRARVRVTRDAAGLWTLESDTTGTGNSYVSEGSTVDLNHQFSNHVGVFTKYTSTRSQWCYLDSINVFASVAPDTTSPSYISARAIAPDTAVLDFSEVLDPVTALDPLNFRLNGPTNPTNVQFFGMDSSQLRLAFGTPFMECALNDLEVTLVEDTAGNVVVDSTQSFTFATPAAASFRDVIINEIHVRNSASGGLPNEDYVELYNRGLTTVNLQGWTLTDNQSNTGVITQDSFLLCPGEYVIFLSDSSGWSGFPVNILEAPSSLPNLGVSGDDIVIRDGFGQLMDSLSYPGSWFPISSPGISRELINPEDTCVALDSNWVPSLDLVGGTPGMQNSVFDTVITDVVGPQLLSVTVVGGNSLQLCFDEALDPGVAGVESNYSVDNTVGIPQSASVLATNSSCVELVYPGGTFSSGILYTVTANGMSDCYGNSSGAQTDQFLVAGPSNFKDVVVNEIFSDIELSVSPLLVGQYIELYNRSNSIVDLSGWELSDAVGSETLETFILAPGEYLLLCEKNDSLAFAGLGPINILGVDGLPGFNTNSADAVVLEDAFGSMVDSVGYSDALFSIPTDAVGGVSLELVNYDDTCSLIGIWDGSIDAVGGTPGEVNSIFNSNGGIDPTALTGTTVLSSNSVEFCFNETMDAGLLTDPANYSGDNGLGNPTSANVVGINGNCVALTFADTFSTGTLYTISISGLSDCNGNPGSVMTAQIFLNGTSAYKDVVINEVFTDSNPSSAGLPNFDYIELYNRSNSIIDLNGWTISNGGTPDALDSYLLNPGGYLILCDPGEVSDFQSFGPTLGVTSFPSFNNEDEVILKDGIGILIDSVSYILDWYQDATKELGGWSLELINPNDTCSQLGNWIASDSAIGGTPGRVNSIQDLTAFGSDTTEITGLAILSNNSIEVCFNETMDGGLLSDISNYSLDNGLSVSLATPGGAAGNCVTLIVSPAIAVGTVYTLDMNGLADCNGNPTGPLSGTFVQGGPAAPFQVVINEIMADPNPPVGLPEADFIEIYNNGPTVVELTGWELRDPSTTVAVFPVYNILPGEYLVICDDSDVGDFASFGNALGTPSFPSLNSTGDSLQLYDQFGNLIDYVNYDNDWYQDTDKDNGGWTLERIDPEFSCQNVNNWRASLNSQGGTPGQANSIQGTFGDVTPPTLLSVEVITANLIRLYFDEPLGPDSLLSTGNYLVDNGIGNPLVVFSGVVSDQSVDLLLPDTLVPNQVYCVNVTNLSDCPGNPITVTQQVCFGIPLAAEAGDLVINEVLFDQYSGGADFVELYNNSDKILDLSTVQIGKYDNVSSILDDSEFISTSQLLLLPGEYICVTENKAFQDSVYIPIDPSTIFETDLVSLGTTGENLTVFSNTGVTIDTLNFLDDWHFPNLDDDKGVSLERHDFNRPTQDEDNWHSAASTVRYATPGYENSQVLVAGASEDEVWLDPVTFSPDQQAPDDVLGINYDFETPMNFRITIFDNKGRLVRLLKQNTLSGTEKGSFTWAGINDAGRRVDVGIYIILVEATNPNTGKVSNFKLGCVVAAPFSN